MDLEEKVKATALEAITLERNLMKLESELMLDERFATFIAKQKEVQAIIADTWKTIEKSMIDHDIKSVKGEWGSITIAERLNWKTTDDLPAKFYKKIVNTTKLSDTYRLEGKPPKGATPTYSKYLTKRIK